MKDPLIELQTRSAFQEDALLELTKTVMTQQREIMELKRDVEQLRMQVRTLTAPDLPPDAGEPPPPHY